MHFNPATLILIAALTVAASACVEGGPANSPGVVPPGATVSVTEMVQQPDGSWTTTSHMIPAGQAPRVDEGDGVERARRALAISPCSQNSTVVLWEGANYTGRVLCLTPNDDWQAMPLSFPVRSGYTTTPIYLFEARGDGGTQGLAFFSCNNSFKWSSAFSATAYSAQQASARHAVCSF